MHYLQPIDWSKAIAPQSTAEMRLKTIGNPQHRLDKNLSQSKTKKYNDCFFFITLFHLC